MTETALVTKLKTITGKEAYALEKPKSDNYCVVYQQISMVKARAHDGGGLFRSRYQLSCYGPTFADSRNMARAIITALDGNTSDFLLSTMENMLVTKEIDSNLYRSIVDVFIWE